MAAQELPPPDAVPLREHIQRQLDMRQQMFEHQLAEQRLQLDERYQTQTRALDAAFAAAEKAVGAALLSAERAAAKAEAAADKRLESVNDLQQQLADQAAKYLARTEAQNFLARTEADVRFNALADKVEASAKKLSDIELHIQSRLDLTQGSGVGMDKAWGYLIALIGLAGGVVALVISLQ